MSLYNKHRPPSFDQVKGNTEVVQTLQGMLKKKETFPHAILFHGLFGCGKTSLARIVANELGCVGTDLVEMNASDHSGIDDIRAIIQNSQFLPLSGLCRVWIIDECHRWKEDAQNCILKILEDTPAHVYFILCTTDLHKLKETVKSRCSQFQVNPLSDSQMFSLLRRITKDEGQELDKIIFDQIIQDSLGHPRNAIQILEQVLNSPTDKRLEVARQTAVEQSQIIELCRALINKERWGKVKTIVEGLKGQEPEDIRRAVLGYMQAVLLKGENDRAAVIIESFWEPTYNLGFPYITFASYSITNLK